MFHPPRRRAAASLLRQGGFTLVELLVVIAIIGILIAILIPAIAGAKESARSTVCISNLRQIATAVRLYTMDNRGWTFVAQNYGFWEFPRGTIIPGDHPRAYWGIPYLKYAANRRDLWYCPSVKLTDTDPGYSDFDYQPATYGMNKYMSGRKLETVRKHSEAIFAQDAFEHLLEADDDSCARFPGYRYNMSQWREWPVAAVRPLAISQFYRHRRYCNVVFLDTHVFPIRESFGDDVPYQWYTGK